MIKSTFIQSDLRLYLLYLFRSLSSNLPKKETVERFIDRLIDLSKRFPCTRFYFKSLIDNASFYWSFLKYPSSIHKHIYSTNPIEAVFIQIRRQEIISLFSVFPLVQNPAGL